MINLTQEQRANITAIVIALNNKNLTNKFLQAGIVSVCYKESGLIPHSEQNYSNTPNNIIRRTFLVTRAMNDLDLNTLKKDPIKFFNLVYNTNPWLGNIPNSNDGYNFRGKGLNQITGRANVKAMGDKIGIDLVNNPDLLNTIDVATKALAQFFFDSLISGQSQGLFKARYLIARTSEIPTLHTGATIAHQANMGWKYSPSQDVTGGYKVTLANAPFFYDIIK